MWSRYACVSNEMEWVVIWLTPCHESSLSFIFHGHVFGHAFFFWHAFWPCGIPFLGMHLFIHFIFFTAHTINNMERMITTQSRSFYFMDGWWIMLIPNVGISHMNMGVYVILITRYEKIFARITQFDKTQWNSK